jgi:hypothetical protein
MIIDQHRIAMDCASDIQPLIDDWKSRWPQMGVLALVSEADKDHISQLQATVRACQVPLCGAVFPALVTDTGFTTSGAWLLCFETMPPRFLTSGVGPGQDGVAALTAAILDIAPASPTEGAKGTSPTLFLIFDGMLPHIGTLLDGVRATFDDSLLYAGVNAGSETFQPTPCLFDEHSLIGEGALGLLLPNPTQIVLHHGYPVSQRLMEATSTMGNRIDTIDGHPALEVYQNVVFNEYGVTLTPENFYDLAAHFPFGVVTVVDVLVRIPVAFTDDGALVCVGEVPPNNRLRLLRAPDLEHSRCVSKIAHALDPLDTGAASSALLTFYCAGRRMHFGADAAREIEQLKTATQSPCIFGALTLGEIDSLEDLSFPRFHNAAIVCISNPA